MKKNTFLELFDTYAKILRRYNLSDVEGIMKPIIDKHNPDKLLVHYGRNGVDKLLEVSKDKFFANGIEDRISQLKDSYERIYSQTESLHGSDWANGAMKGIMSRDLGFNPFSKPDLYRGYYINYGSSADHMALNLELYSNPNFVRTQADSDLIELAKNVRTPRAGSPLYFVPKFSEDGSVIGKYQDCALIPSLQLCNKDAFDEFILLCKNLADKVYNDIDKRDAVRLIDGMSDAMDKFAKTSSRDPKKALMISDVMGNAYALFGVKELPKKNIQIAGTDFDRQDDPVYDDVAEGDDPGYVVAKEDTGKLVAAAVQATAVEIQGPVNVNYEKGKGGSVKAVITSPFDDVMDVTIVPPTDPAQ